MRFNRRSEERSTPVTWDTFFAQNIGAFKAFSGKAVSEETALKNSVVWRSTSMIADAVASLPPRAYTEDKDGRPVPADLPAWIRKPSVIAPGARVPDIRRYDFMHQMLVSILLWGNAYARIIRRGSDGQILSLLLLNPAWVNCLWVLNSLGQPTGIRQYQVYGGQWLSSKDIFHVQGMTLPGRPHGMSVIGQAREAVGLGLTLEEFGARYFAQGSMHKVVLKVPNTGNLSSAQKSTIVKDYEQFHKGPANWHRPALLTGPPGSDIVNVSVPPEDAQFLQSREFQALDVARWFGVPPHRVGIISKQSSWGSGLAEENTALVQSTYRRYILAFESAFTAYLPGGEDNGIRIRLDDSALLRGTIKDQVTTWTAAVQGQIVTPNEARAQIGLPPIDGGDELVHYVSPKSKMENPQPGNDQPDPAQDEGAAPKNDTGGTQAADTTKGGSDGGTQ